MLAYVGGIAWPFFSDMGRDAPAYHFFVFGLTLCSVLHSAMWFVNFLYLHARVGPLYEQGKVSAHVVRMHYIVGCIGMTSGLGLPILVRQEGCSDKDNDVTLFFFSRSLMSCIIE